VGPLDLPRGTRAALIAAGEALAGECGLRGLFGLDFLLDGSAVRPVELNPRYTAAVEILEHARCLRALELHAAAWGAPVDPPPPAGSDIRKEGAPSPLPAVLGKAVLFATEEMVALPDIRRLQPADPGRVPTFADLPAPGTVIPRRRPVITVFAGGRDPPACLEALRHELETVRSFFRATRQGGLPASSSSADRGDFFL
jgi:predicted ATP-grasp superfamily ATP-dependent carboligase